MLKGNNVILRPLEFGDLIFFYKWRNNCEIKELALLPPYPITKEQEQEWYENVAKNKTNKVIFFTITDTKNTAIGYTQLNRIDWINKNCYFGIIIGEEEERKKGVGKEVLKLISNYTFNTLNLKKITLEVVATNLTAIKFYEKFGFVLEGTLKNHIFNNGKYNDLKIYSLHRPN